MECLSANHPPVAPLRLQAYRDTARSLGYPLAVVSLDQYTKLAYIRVAMKLFHISEIFFLLLLMNACANNYVCGKITLMMPVRMYMGKDK